MLYLFIFIFGACMGSFLNVLADRLPRDEKISGRSYCDNCHKTLAWYDLIPLFSFLILRGRCRYCRKKISWQYPAVEMITGLLFVAIFSQFGFEAVILSTSLPFSTGSAKDLMAFPFTTGFLASLGMTAFDFSFWLLATSFLIVIFVSDLKYYIIPDKIIYPAIGLALIYRFLHAFQFDSLTMKQWSNETMMSGFFAAFLASSFFLILWAISHGRWLGFGDVKLAAFMGLLLGWPSVLVALFLAFVLGAIIGVGLILFDKKTLKSQVPFGPFLVIGTFIAVFWGQKIVEWYMNLLLL